MSLLWGTLTNKDEFFIRDVNPEVENHSEFHLIPSRIPLFLEGVAEKILSTGKCLRVIRSLELQKNSQTSFSSFFQKQLPSTFGILEKEFQKYIDCDLKHGDK